MTPNRRTAVLAALVLSVPLASCLDQQPSLYPLFRESEAVEMPALVGNWIDTDDGRTHLYFEPDGGDYKLTVTRDGDTSTNMVLAARFGRIGSRTFIDITAADAKSGVYGLMPIHAFGPVESGEGRLAISLLDPTWTHEQIRSGRVLLAHKIVEDEVLLTASSRELKRAMAESAAEAFQKPMAFARPAARPAS